MALDSVHHSQIDELLFQFLKYVYRWERVVHARIGLTCQAIYLFQYLRKASPARVSDLAVELRITEHE